MAYSTGSGTYLDMMAAVFAHAIADGWTEANGVGTGWPISKGNVGAVAWDTITAAVTNYTQDSTVPKTERHIRFGIGDTGAEATANISNNVRAANAEYNIAAWHIFSDVTAGNYIHVAYTFNTEHYTNVYSHFSFGEIDRSTIGGTGFIAYITALYARGYAIGPLQHSNASTYSNWHYPASMGAMFSGTVGTLQTADSHHFTWKHGPTGIVVPEGAGWPAPGAYHQSGSGLWKNNHQGNLQQLIPNFAANQYRSDGTLNYQFHFAKPHPYSGSISLASMPIMPINGTGTGNRTIWSGVAPDVRLCSMEDYAPGDEVTFAGDTWIIFPWLRKTSISDLGLARTVTSGTLGYAYKKVA